MGCERPAILSKDDLDVIEKDLHLAAVWYIENLTLLLRLTGTNKLEMVKLLRVRAASRLARAIRIQATLSFRKISRRAMYGPEGIEWLV